MRNLAAVGVSEWVSDVKHEAYIEAGCDGSAGERNLSSCKGSNPGQTNRSSLVATPPDIF